MDISLQYVCNMNAELLPRRRLLTSTSPTLHDFRLDVQYNHPFVDIVLKPFFNNFSYTILVLAQLFFPEGCQLPASKVMLIREHAFCSLVFGPKACVLGT